MIKIKKLEEGAYNIEIMGDGETIVDEYTSLTEYLSSKFPGVILAATERISKKLEDL